jgi:hypothetical protein
MTTKTFSNKNILIGGLLSGFFINFCDVLITISTVADDWNKVLESQGIAFNPLTPPYYITASFMAGIVLCWLLSILQLRYGWAKKNSRLRFDFALEHQPFVWRRSCRDGTNAALDFCHDVRRFALRFCGWRTSWVLVFE